MHYCDKYNPWLSFLVSVSLFGIRSWNTPSRSFLFCYQWSHQLAHRYFLSSQILVIYELIWFQFKEQRRIMVLWFKSFAKNPIATYPSSCTFKIELIFILMRSQLPFRKQKFMQIDTAKGEITLWLNSEIFICLFHCFSV